MPYYKFNEAAYGGGGVEREITSIPYIVDGKSYLDETKKDASGKLYVMEARFANSKGEDEYRQFLYTVDSAKRTLTIQEIKDIDYNSNYDGITAYTEGQLKLSYTFAFKGLSLTLTKDSHSVELYTGYSDTDDTSPYLSVNGYLTKGSKSIDKIYNFNFYRSTTTSSSSIYISYKNDKNEDETSYYCGATMTRDGLFTFAVPYASQTKTYQYVYFYLDDHGFILTDGTTNYLYTMTEKEYTGK